MIASNLLPRSPEKNRSSSEKDPRRALQGNKKEKGVSHENNYLFVRKIQYKKGKDWFPLLFHFVTRAFFWDKGKKEKKVLPIGSRTIY
jgi:hypothetical protein